MGKLLSSETAAKKVAILLLDQQGNSCPRVKRYSLLSQEVYPALVT
jgi:hypothetical protein